jgi:prepilin-type N-terminal cleavage/methylation domain-containing protein
MNFMKKGFTLIELLIVISIIGILAALAAFSFTGSQRQARDTQRKSDLSQYRTVLESFANKSNGIYPLHASTINAADLCPELNSSLGLSGGCPEDPKVASDPSHSQYKYQSDASATKYVLWAQVENITNAYWIVCSTGQSGKVDSAPQISGGGCPL